MSESIVKTKSFELAIRGVNFYKWLVSEKKEFIMSKQFLRSITSVGANVREAVNAQSKADFIHKLSVSQKECDESMYWLEILNATDYINKVEFESIHQQCNEVLKIIKSIIITSKKNLI
ncbi:four helix bundle protein [Flavobacterium circumlabens]|uniref:Four helix bundle protein n=1 Tax=Flavobacterium circumlabens TaxID=2133765 RepID=A0A4Y7UBQ6_9FLAO|nr:four helix bundle protein [Flavobacterium circumlabens]TCN56261.1 four helix bundle protein [Flavobacterium circumlabens]TEB43651.1 four helix bundle protein [Flavobacterium circumlabens]